MIAFFTAPTVTPAFAASWARARLWSRRVIALKFSRGTWREKGLLDHEEVRARRQRNVAQS